MDTLIAAALGSIKVLVLLTAAWGLSVALRGRPARLRAAIWATALVGSLLIPIFAPILPSFFVEMPINLPRPPAEIDIPAAPATIVADRSLTSVVDGPTTAMVEITDVAPKTGWAMPAPEILIALVWAAVAILLLAHHAIACWSMSRIIHTAEPVTDDAWLDLVNDVRAQVGCRWRVRLVRTSAIDIPSVFGTFRPVIVLPKQSHSWLRDRREAVLQHEIVHLVRLDWLFRIVARIAGAIYWFNPLVWLAVRRLELEQEMACDEEVLSLGSRASSYACHLLGIARTAVQRPALTTAGLAMARRTHLEERIMRILSRSNHRRVGLAVILPAVILTAALVPAIASVQPTDSEPQKASPARTVSPARTASPELKAAVAEMEAAEENLEPYLAQIEDVEIDIEPIIKQIEDIDIDIDHEAIARIEAEMAPTIAEIEKLTIDMEPVHAQIEAMHEQIENIVLHVEDGTLDEIQRQMHEQMEAHRAQMEDLHIDLSSFHEQMALLEEQLEPLHEKIADLTEEHLAQVHEQIEKSHELSELEHEGLESMHAEIERIHEKMEPITDEMERMGVRIESALVSDVADVLREQLGPVARPGAPFTEAAARIVDEGNIHLDDGVLELDASRREIREILEDLFSPERLGTEEGFNDAIEAATNEVADLRILVD